MPIDRRILAELRRRQQNGLFAVAVELTNRAKVLATKHHDNGTRRNSITQTKSSDGRTVLWGIPAKAAPHAPHLERGFKPHWVPGRHIGLWMTRNKVGSNMTAIATLHGVTRLPGKAERRAAVGTQLAWRRNELDGHSRGAERFLGAQRVAHRGDEDDTVGRRGGAPLGGAHHSDTTLPAPMSISAMAYMFDTTPAATLSFRS